MNAGESCSECRQAGRWWAAGRRAARRSFGSPCAAPLELSAARDVLSSSGPSQAAGYLEFVGAKYYASAVLLVGLHCASRIFFGIMVSIPLFLLLRSLKMFV